MREGGLKGRFERGLEGTCEGKGLRRFVGRV